MTYPIPQRIGSRRVKNPRGRIIQAPGGLPVWLSLETCRCGAASANPGTGRRDEGQKAWVCEQCGDPHTAITTDAHYREMQQIRIAREGHLQALRETRQRFRKIAGRNPGDSPAWYNVHSLTRMLGACGDRYLRNDPCGHNHPDIRDAQQCWKYRAGGVNVNLIGSNGRIYIIAQWLTPAPQV